MASPTDETYDELQLAWNHFNHTLFEGKLPLCLITLQREKQTLGYFSAERFVHLGDGGITDEIAMNPAHFGIAPLQDVMQTLVHEMVHQWQHHFGKPGRGRYHNAEWAAKMEAIGLMPSSTGHPGGARTGDHMNDYVITGGRFEAACAQLLDQAFRISWADRYPSYGLASMIEDGNLSAGNASVGARLQALQDAGDRIQLPAAPVAKATRRKFTCPSCQANLWGKPSLHVICGDCSIPFA